MKGREISDYHYNILLGKLDVHRPPRAQDTEILKRLLDGETIKLREVREREDKQNYKGKPIKISLKLSFLSGLVHGVVEERGGR